MANYNHQARVQAQLESAFEGLTSKQIMAIISFSKLVRLRCRSNAALKNAVASIFGEKFKAKFKEVAAVNRRGEQYTALVCLTPEGDTLNMAQEEGED